MICLATPRLLLRTWCVEDGDDLESLLRDPTATVGTAITFSAADAGAATNQVTSTLFPANAESAIEFLERAWQAVGYGVFAVESLDGGELVGVAGFEAAPDPASGIDLVWRFRRTDAGASLAVETLSAILDWGFGLLDIDKLGTSVPLDDTDAEQIVPAAGLSLTSRTLDAVSNQWMNRFTITFTQWHLHTVE